MARIGVDYTTNHAGGDTAPDTDALIVEFPSGVPVNATLDSVEFCCYDDGSSDDFRLAVYEGGASGDSEDATLVWQSGRETLAGESIEWSSPITAGSESLTAGTRLWVAFRCQSSAGRLRAPTGEDGDCGGSTYYFNSTHPEGTIDSTFPSTAPAMGAARLTDPLKVVINYTEAASRFPYESIKQRRRAMMTLLTR